MSSSNTQIRIAFLIDTIEENFGGTETQLNMLINHLDRSTFEPYLCFLRDSSWLRANQWLCPQFNVDIRSFYHPISWFRILQLARFLRRKRIDILQIHFRDSSIAGTVAAKIARVPIVLATRRNQGHWHNRIELMLLRLLNPAASRFIANARSIHKHVQEVERVPAEKIEVIYNGVVLDAFGGDVASTRKEVRAELELSIDAPVVIMVANLRPVKGIEVFLEALKAVIPTHPETRVLIVGEGTERQRLQAIVDSSGLAGTVQFLGSRTDVPRLMLASDIGVLSSHSEGLSNAVIEYMAAALPVVCTNVGGNPELVKDGINGYVVPASDSAGMAKAIDKLLTDPERARELGQRGRLLAHDMFSVSRYVERTQKLYRSLAPASWTERRQEPRNNE